MNREEALIFLKNDLRKTEECILIALSGNHQRELRALQHSAEAYRFAIDVLQNQEEKVEQQPLTMAELRKMNGETVYCLELNTDVKILARKHGFISVRYQFPGGYGECKAMGLTLYRTEPKEEV